MFIGVDFKNLIIHSQSFVLCFTASDVARGGGRKEFEGVKFDEA